MGLGNCDAQVVSVKFEGNRAPYLAYNIPLIRVADEDKVMDQDIYDEMLRKRGDVSNSWELQESKYTVEDIIERDFDLYLKRAKEVKRISFDSENPKVVLDKLELLAEDGVHLLNAGAVLFCNSSMNDVQMAKFATNVKATFTDIRREDRGSIIGLARVCEQYIIDAMDWKADIIGLKRVETPEIPIEAIREAIINSYGHRLYNNNQCNEIDVFKDRIEIHTTGGFPKGHTPEEFLDGNRKAIRRNKLITGVLYYSYDMETFATGLKRIKDHCDEAGCEVEFRTEIDDFVVVFYRNLREKWNESEPHVINGGNDTENGTENGTDMEKQANIAYRFISSYPKSKQKTAIKIAAAIINDRRRTIQDIANEAGVSKRTAARYMKELQEAGALIRKGSDTSGEWILK